MTIDRRGTLHLAWVWRDSPDVATNHDICYARSSDEGRTWSDTNGTPVAIPITARTAEYAVRIPQNSNVMHSPAITADDGGRPYVTTYWSAAPGGPPQFRVVHHDGAVRRSIEGPARSDVFTLSGGGTKAPPISRAVVLVEGTSKASRIHLVYRASGPAGRGRVPAANLEQPGARTWTVQNLTAEHVGAWEPAIDPAAWAALRQVHMLVQRVEQRDGDDRTGAAAPSATRRSA